MLVTFLLLLLVAVVLGIIGVAAEGLGWLLAVGIVLLVVDVVLAVTVWARRARNHPAR
ncbi:hypothetical protein [Streptomyces sp. Amel2xC10]|uniref:hypothetical protein n=1 Tax=Streptomyces sp. Amel2xC10 TaxID=1305826 RepID=UPI000A08AE3F|nr:hypothetical protein [Streptomyces sp. Amel2xC10]SMF71924.1 hypothetical protein SAMN02745830_05569 [Streptomyces sp. Amel2xC10]